MRLRHVLASVLLGAAGTALGQELNLVSSVEVEDAGAAVVLSVRGSKAPSFTTFSMADPPRFVIDLSEARFKGVPDEIAVEDGTIRLVRNLSYGSDAASIARIMLAFAADVQPPDVQIRGTTLVVRVAKVAGQAAIAQREEARPPAAVAPSAAVAPPSESASAAAPQGPGGAADLEAERQREEALAAVRAYAERKKLQEAEGKAAESATLAAAAAEAEAKRQREEAIAAERAEAERKKAEEAERQAEAKRQREEAIAAERAEAERRKAEEAERQSEAKRQREEAIVSARVEAERKKAEEAERRAEAKRVRDEERLARAAARADALAASPPPAQLREVGFRQMEGFSRVFVRTSAPPHFTIQDVGDDVIRVELENTRIVHRNDTRLLDTSFFPSAVAMITPAKHGSSYVVDIKLKEKVPYQQRIEGDMLAIDFERPAAPAAASSPVAAPEGGAGN